MSEVMQKQNFRNGEIENPRKERSERFTIYVLKVTTCEQVRYHYPYFLEDGQGETVTVNRTNDRRWMSLRSAGSGYKRQWYDSHTLSVMVQNVIFISTRGLNGQISICGCFWRVASTVTKGTDHPKKSTMKEILNVPQKNTSRVIQNIGVRIPSVIGQRGNYVKHAM